MDLRELAITDHSSPRHPWEIARSRIVMELLRRHSSGRRRILDIGCGDGYVAHRLSETGFVEGYWGVDAAIDEATQQRILRSLRMADAQFDVSKSIDSVPNQSADTVLLLDVIEHVPDELELFGKIAAKLAAKESLFIVTVPAWQGLFSEHDVFLGHYRRYSPSGFRKTLEKANLEIVENGGFFFCLLFVRLLQKWLERKSPRGNQPKSGVSQWGGSPFLTRLVSAVLWTDYQICRLLRIPGLSLYAVCKPKK